GVSSRIKAAQFVPGMSLAVTIMNSPHGMPLPKSMPRIRPRAIGERTVALSSIPGKLRSSTYCARPVTLSNPSLRRIGWPTIGFCILARLKQLCGTDFSLFHIIWSLKSRNHVSPINFDRLLFITAHQIDIKLCHAEFPQLFQPAHLL